MNYDIRHQLLLLHHASYLELSQVVEYQETHGVKILFGDFLQQVKEFYNVFEKLCFLLAKKNSFFLK